jgi:hypothetical protein
MSPESPRLRELRARVQELELELERLKLEVARESLSAKSDGQDKSIADQPERYICRVCGWTGEGSEALDHKRDTGHMLMWYLGPRTGEW